jgi:membrane fusion protein (multidrug efflux system)
LDESEPGHLRLDAAPARADAPTRERDRREVSEPPPARADSPAPDGSRRTDKPAEGEKKSGSKRPLIIVGLIALLAIIAGAIYWYTTRNEEDTDDAYTDGRAVSIAAQVSGYVVDLAVNDNQFVHAGQVIVKIDPRDYIAARDQARGQLEVAQGQLAAARAGLAVAKKNFPARLESAKAQLQAAQAGLVKAQQDARRQHNVARGATTQEQVDQADAALLQAQANVAQAEANVREASPVQENIDQTAAQASQIEGQVALAKAQLDQAELNLSHTVITAPQDGWVTKRNVELGNYLTTGSSIMSLVSPQVWVTANFKESQLARMRPGQRVDISVDAYPNLRLTGHVDSIQLGSGSKFTAFPAENATGNFVKIVQRVPVKIDIDSGLDPNLPLPLGLSVDPTVTLK